MVDRIDGWVSSDGSSSDEEERRNEQDFNNLLKDIVEDDDDDEGEDDGADSVPNSDDDDDDYDPRIDSTEATSQEFTSQNTNSSRYSANVSKSRGRPRTNKSWLERENPVADIDWSEKPFRQTCMTCQREFTSPQNFVWHSPCYDYLNQPHDVKCPKCDKVFAKSAYLKMHLPYHLEKRITCNICGLKTHFPEEIKRHIKIKHFDMKYSYAPEGSKKVYQCSHCPKIYACNKAFKSHNERYHPDSTYTGAVKKRIRRWWKKPADADLDPVKPKISSSPSMNRAQSSLPITVPKPESSSGKQHATKRGTPVAPVSIPTPKSAGTLVKAYRRPGRPEANREDPNRGLPNPSPNPTLQSSQKTYSVPSSSQNQAKSYTSLAAALAARPGLTFSAVTQKYDPDTPDDFNMFRIITGPSEDGTFCPPAQGFLSCVELGN